MVEELNASKEVEKFVCNFGFICSFQEKDTELEALQKRMDRETGSFQRKLQVCEQKNTCRLVSVPTAEDVDLREFLACEQALVGARRLGRARPQRSSKLCAVTAIYFGGHGL